MGRPITLFTAQWADLTFDDGLREGQGARL